MDCELYVCSKCFVSVEELLFGHINFSSLLYSVVSDRQCLCNLLQCFLPCQSPLLQRPRGPRQLWAPPSCRCTHLQQIFAILCSPIQSLLTYLLPPPPPDPKPDTTHLHQTFLLTHTFLLPLSVIKAFYMTSWCLACTLSLSKLYKVIPWPNIYHCLHAWNTFKKLGQNRTEKFIKYLSDIVPNDRYKYCYMGLGALWKTFYIQKSLQSKEAFIHQCCAERPPSSLGPSS